MWSNKGLVLAITAREMHKLPPKRKAACVHPRAEPAKEGPELGREGPAEGIAVE
jgi:hypothetical protein